LQINKTRFFALLKEYRRDPDTFSIDYERETRNRLSAEAEAAIQEELRREKKLVEDPDLPISAYNYTRAARSFTEERLPGFSQYHHSTC